MKYVVDASIGFKWLVIEQETAEARKLRDGFRNAIIDLLAPDIFPVEITHALTRADRQRRITPAEGAALVKDLLQNLPQLHAYLALLPRAYEISSNMRVGTYDCLYVALAERENCELVTADDKLVKNIQQAFPFVVSLSSLP